MTAELARQLQTALKQTALKQTALKRTALDQAALPEQGARGRPVRRRTPSAIEGAGASC